MNTLASHDLADQILSTPPTSVEQESRTVLIVDDNDGILEAITSILDQAGYNVVSFPQAQLALEYLRKGDTADLIISDVIMPSMGGCRLALMAHAHNSRLPVLFITGHSLGRLKPHLECREQCSVTILQKPFNMHTLLDRVSCLIGGAPSGCAGMGRRSALRFDHSDESKHISRVMPEDADFLGG